MIKEICQFNKEVIGIEESHPHLLSETEKEWLMTALNEEVAEFKEAYDNMSLTDSVDALLDLTYFAIGGLYRQGLSAEKIQACFNIIHNANMSKAKGVKKGREGFDGVGDAVKPEDWQSPEEQIKALLHG